MVPCIARLTVFRWYLPLTLYLLIFLSDFIGDFFLIGSLRPYIYLCYVDDTFACFSSHNELFCSSVAWMSYILPQLLLWRKRMTINYHFWTCWWNVVRLLSLLVYTESPCSQVCIWVTPKSRKVNLIQSFKDLFI